MISDGHQHFKIYSTGSILRSKYKSKGHHLKIYPNHKNNVRFEFLAFSFFQRYLAFPDWTTSSKDMEFLSWAPPLFSLNFQKINPLISRKPIIWSMKNFRFEVWGRNQHVCQISLNSEGVGFSPLGDLTWNDPYIFKAAPIRETSDFVQYGSKIWGAVCKNITSDRFSTKTAISGRDSYLCMQRCYLW